MQSPSRTYRSHPTNGERGMMVWSCTLVARAHLLKSFDLEPISGEEPRRDKRARVGGELASASLQHESPGVGDQRHLSARNVTVSLELDTAQHALEVGRSSRRVRVGELQPAAPGCVLTDCSRGASNISAIFLFYL